VLTTAGKEHYQGKMINKNDLNLVQKSIQICFKTGQLTTQICHKLPPQLVTKLQPKSTES